MKARPWLKRFKPFRPFQRSWRRVFCRKHRQHTPLRQILIRHQTATLCRGWR